MDAGAVYPRAWDGSAHLDATNMYDYPTPTTDLDGKDRFRSLIPMTPKVHSVRPANLTQWFARNITGAAADMPRMGEGQIISSMPRDLMDGQAQSGMVPERMSDGHARQPQVAPPPKTPQAPVLRPDAAAAPASEVTVFGSACMTSACTQEMRAARGHIRPNMRTQPAPSDRLQAAGRFYGSTAPRRPAVVAIRPTAPELESHQLRGEKDGLQVGSQQIAAAPAAPFVERDLRQPEHFNFTSALVNNIAVRSGRAPHGGPRRQFEATSCAVDW